MPDDQGAFTAPGFGTTPTPPLPVGADEVAALPERPPPLPVGADQVAALPSGTQDPSKAGAFGPSDNVVHDVMQEEGKPYSGPLAAKPQSDDARWGDPGWDCSSLVSGMYAKQGIKLTPYTDTAYNETYTPKPEDQKAGDVVFFKYKDASQPNTTYPHMAIYMGKDAAGQPWIADANYGQGKVVVEPMLKLPYEIRRPLALQDKP